MNQNYQIGDYLNLDGDVYPYRVIDVSNPTPFYGETYVMIENGCDNGLSPIKITPETLEAFGFKKDVALNDIEFWHILLGEVDIAVIPSSKGWWVRISGKNYVSVQVCNIHDIQHAMRVARITKELEYKEK